MKLRLGSIRDLACTAGLAGFMILAGPSRPTYAATYSCGPVHISGAPNVGRAFLNCEVWYVSPAPLPATATDSITIVNPSGTSAGSAGPTSDGGAVGPKLLDFANDFTPPLGNSYTCQVTLAHIPPARVRVLLSVENEDGAGNLLSEQDIPCRLP